MKSKELKLVDDLTNASDDRWFNPVIMGIALSNQPLYTVDRIMELVANIVRHNSMRYKTEWENGNTSEGLFLAKELNDKIVELIKQYRFDNLSLPKNPKKVIADLPEPDTVQKYSWLHEDYRNPFNEVQAVL
jgi:hypothetical protein